MGFSSCPRFEACFGNHLRNWEAEWIVTLRCSFSVMFQKDVELPLTRICLLLSSGKEESIGSFPEVWLCCGYLHLNLSLSQLKFAKENWILKHFHLNPTGLWCPGTLITFKHITRKLAACWQTSSMMGGSLPLFMGHLPKPKTLLAKCTIQTADCSGSTQYFKFLQTAYWITISGALLLAQGRCPHADSSGPVQVMDVDWLCPFPNSMTIPEFLI